MYIVYKINGLKEQEIARTENLNIALCIAERYIPDTDPLAKARVIDSIDNAICYDNATVPLENLELGVRAYNILKREGVNTLEDLAKIPLKDMTKLRHMNPKTTIEILKAITTHLEEQ